MQMKILPSIKDVTHIALIGRFDNFGIQTIETEFQSYIESRMRPTIVDLSEVTLLPSAGMRMLLNGARVLRDKGTKMVLLSPSPLIEEVLRTACLDQIFPIVHDEHEALKLLIGR